MNRRPPRWILLGMFLASATIPCVAQQPTTGTSENPTKVTNVGPAPGSLTPKQMQEERAKVLMAEKRYEAAIDAYQDLLKVDPKNALFMNMIGIAYLDLGNFEQAKKYFIRSSKADKKYPSAVNNLGMVYYHEKNFRAAIRQYQRAVAIDPNQAGGHSNLGFAYYNTNKFPEAAAEFQKALELDPSIFERNDRAGAVVQDRSVSNHGLFFFTMAKVYAEKRDAVHCAEYLRKSLDEGYKDVGKAATDPAMQDVLVRIAPADQKGSASHPGA